jgi:hypothetical protein
MGATSHRAGSFLPRQSSLRATLALNLSRVQAIRPSILLRTRGMIRPLIQQL